MKLGKFGDYVSFLRNQGRAVINRAKEAGVSDEEVETKKRRMLDWLRYVNQYDVDCREVMTDPKMPAHTKRELLDSMSKIVTEERIRRFGA